MKITYDEQLCKSILHRINKSTLPFNWGANPYRGCLHSCIYCYARYTHSYLDLDPNRDFETKIIAKINAPQILRKEFSSPKWKQELVNLGSVCDPYQPIEKKYQITQAMLKIFSQFRNPLIIATKSDLILRDLDVLQKLHQRTYLNIVISISSLDKKIQRELEPRAASTEKRLKAINTLHNAGLKVGVLYMPIVPSLNDSREEIENLFAAFAEAGADFVLPGILYLQGPTKQRFFDFLEQEHPELVNEYRILYRKRSPIKHYKTEMKTFLREMTRKYNLNNYHTYAPKKENQLTIDSWLKK